MVCGGVCIVRACASKQVTSSSSSLIFLLQSSCGPPATASCCCCSTSVAEYFGIPFDSWEFSSIGKSFPSFSKGLPGSISGDDMLIGWRFVCSAKQKRLTSCHYGGGSLADETKGNQSENENETIQTRRNKNENEMKRKKNKTKRVVVH